MLYGENNENHRENPTYLHFEFQYGVMYPYWQTFQHNCRQVSYKQTTLDEDGISVTSIGSAKFSFLGHVMQIQTTTGKLEGLGTIHMLEFEENQDISNSELYAPSDVQLQTMFE